MTVSAAYESVYICPVDGVFHEAGGENLTQGCWDQGMWSCAFLTRHGWWAGCVLLSFFPPHNETSSNNSASVKGRPPVFLSRSSAESVSLVTSPPLTWKAPHRCKRFETLRPLFAVLISNLKLRLAKPRNLRLSNHAYGAVDQMRSRPEYWANHHPYLPTTLVNLP